MAFVLHHRRPGKPSMPAWRVVGIMLVVVLASTPASAQTPQPTMHTQVEVEPVDGLLIPGQDPVTVTLMVQVHCEPPSVAIFPMEVGHRLETDSDYVTGSLSAQSHTIAMEMQSCIAVPVIVEYEVEATLVVSSKTPAHEEIEFRFYTTLNEEEKLAAVWTQTAALQGNLVVDAYPTSLWANPGETATSEAQIINRANAPMIVTITLEDAPEHGEITFPETLTVPYTPGGPASVTPFELEYHRQQPGPDFFTMQIIAAPIGQADDALPPSALVYHVQGPSGNGHETGESPPGPFALALVALLVGLWRSTRYER